MAYYQEPQILQGHTGTGGMTTSLAIGTHGPAAERRLLQFPLSPILNTGRSDLKPTTTLEDPRFHNVTCSKVELQRLAVQQWTSRSRPVNTREEIEAALKERE
jgi:hypothetical protein